METSLGIVLATAGAALGLAVGSVGTAPATAATPASPAATWALDSSFSGDGVLTTSLPGGQSEADWAHGVVVQPDGRIVAAGTHHDFDGGSGDTGDLAVVRYRSNGAIDSTFGDDGMVRLSVGEFDDVGDVALQQVGGQTKIVVVGHTFRPSSGGRDHQFFAVRLNADGSLDTDDDADPDVHLDQDGIATVPFRHGGFGLAVTIDPDNRIVVAGYSQPGKPGVRVPAVARLLPEDGAPDPTFSDNGKLTFRPEGRAGIANDVAIQPVGASYRVVIVGSAYVPKGANWVASRLRLDGSADLSFGSGDGHVIVSMRSPRVEQSFERAAGVAVGPDGSITAIGRARAWADDFGDGPTDVPAMIRLTPAGALDPTFSDNGKARLAKSPGGIPDRDGNDVMVDSDRIAYWTGTRYWPTGGPQQWILVGGRLPDGSPDLRFGEEGSLAVSVGPAADSGEAITMDASGRLVVVGIADPASGSSVHAAFAVARLHLE